MADGISTAEAALPGHEASASRFPIARHFRQIVLWPLQLETHKAPAPDEGHHTLLDPLTPTCAWKLLADEFGVPDGDFQERHYREFVSFLPHVQRFLYGDVSGNTPPQAADIPMRVYRRTDVRKVAITLADRAAPVMCDIAHIDLYFFLDVDAVVLAVEISASDVPLDVAQHLIRSFGRAYPSGWTETGEPIHCPRKVEWLGENGAVLASSDFHDRERYLRFVGNRRAACVSKHWEFLLAPLVNDPTDEPGVLRYREIEYYRMPVMSYLAFDDIRALNKGDLIGLGLGTGPDWHKTLPFSDRFIKRFETDYVYERLYSGGLDDPDIDTRFLTSGEAFTVISGGPSPSLTDNERGLLGQFRHQYFLLFLIAHFHKATLIMMSDRLVATLKRLDAKNPESVVAFRNETIQLQEKFLRFSQRYLFNEISGRAHMRDLFAMIGRHLKTEELHQEVRGELFDMVQYLDSNALRRQNTSMHRLTVVTILGLIGTIVTGFLGMNLIAEAEAPLATKITYFAVVTGIVTVMTGFAVVFSSRLTRWIESLSGEGKA